MSEAPEKTDLWMPLWIGDYLADTMNLGRDLHGGYFLLLMAYWRNGGPLPDNQEDLLNVMRGSPDEWPRLKGKLLDRFFLLEAGVWHHKRADEELVVAGRRKASAVARAKKGAAARHAKAGAEIPGSPSGGAASGAMPPAPKPAAAAVPAATPCAACGTASSTASSNPQAVLEASSSPSPSPLNPSGLSSVAKATAAENGGAKPPESPPSVDNSAVAGGPGAQAPLDGLDAAGVPTPPAPARGSARRPVAAPGGPIDPAGPAPRVRYMEPLTPAELRKQQVWRAAKELLDLDGVPEKQKGTFLGQLAGKAGPGDAGFEVFAAAVDSATKVGGRPAGGVREYLTATVQRLVGARESSANKQSALEAGADETLARWAGKNPEEMDP